MPTVNLKIEVNNDVNLGENPGGSFPNLTTTDFTYLIISYTATHLEVRDPTPANNNAAITQIVNAGDVALSTRSLFKLEKGLAQQIQRLISFKRNLSTETSEERNHNWILIKNADITSATVRTTSYEFTDPKITLDDVVIDVMDNVAGTAGNPKINTTNETTRLGNNLEPFRDEFIKIENLIKEDYSNLSLDNTLDTKLTELEDYFEGGASNRIIGADDNAKKQSENIKKTLYQTSTDSTDDDTRYYKTEIDNRIGFLKELKFWKDCGFNNASEVLKANANNFIVDPRGGGNATIGHATHGVKETNLDKTPNANGKANADSLKLLIKNGLYRGFKMTATDQKLENANTADDENIKFSGKKANLSAMLGIGSHHEGSEDAIYRVRAINNFNEVFVVSENGWGGKNNFRGFYPIAHNTYTGSGGAVANPTFNKVVNISYEGVNIMDKTLEVEGRIDKDKTNFATAKDDKYKYEKLTKTCFDILGDGTTTGVATMIGGINLMLGNDYDGAGVGEKKAVLDKQFIALQSAKMQSDGTQNYGINTDGSWNDNAEKANEAYDEGVNFLNYFDVDYSGKNKSDKVVLDKAKTELEKYKNVGTATEDSNKRLIWDFWQNRNKSDGSKNMLITEKISEIEAALRKEVPPKPDQKGLTKPKADDLKTKLADGDIKDPAKKIYQAFSDLLDTDTKKTDGVYDALVDLIDKLGKTDWKDKPKGLKTSFASGDNKTAWDFVNEKTKDDTAYKNKGWALDVAEKAEKLLTDAINKAKGEMSGEGDAVAKTEIESQESIKVVNAIEKLFKLCKEAHGTVATSRTDKLKQDLKAYKEGSGDNKTAWNQIEKYEKTAGKGYAAEAWEKVEAKKKENDKKWEDGLKTVTDVPGAKKFAEDNGFDKNSKQRFEAAVTFKGASDDKGKLLYKIFSIKGTSEYSDSKDKLEEAIKEIENHISELKKLIDATDETSDAGKLKKKLKAITNIDADFNVDTFLTYWKGELEARKTVLESKKDNPQQENPNKTPEGKKWYQEVWGMILIGVVVIVVLGGIAWLIKSNSSEEGEGEDE